MPHPLPFSEFLDALRDKGFGVGLHEYLALGKLLDQWDHTNRDEFRDCLAALVARNHDEAAAIRPLFDEFYPKHPGDEDGGDGPGPGPVTSSRTFTLVSLIRSRWTWAAAVALVAVAATAGLIVRTIVNQPPPVVARALKQPPPATALPAPVDTPTPIASPYAQVLVPPPAVGLPTAPQRVDWRGVGAIAGSALLLTLLPAWGARMRHAARRWTTAAWQSALAALPGPFHGTLVLKDLVIRLPRSDIEEAATIMGRAVSPDQRGGRLDVVRSLNATLRAGMQPHLIFRLRRIRHPILVLRDISQAMAIHERKIAGFVGDLRRQGIALDEWYFDGDLSQTMSRPHGVSVPLETLFRRREDGPVMILSTGQGIAAALTSDDRGWISSLRRQSRRVWIHPVTDSKLWAGALQRLPITVVPLARAGLLQAARLLTQDDRSMSLSLGRLVTTPPVVTRTHVARLKRIASLVPYPTVELLELLRQRFAPDVPDSAVLYTVDRRAASGNLPFRMTDGEIRALLGELRAESPAAEAPIRRYLVKVLADSEPAPGSAAHLRWEASVAIHQAHLADLDHTSGAEAAARLETLYRGPLWDEVRDMVNRQAITGPITSAVRTAVGLSRPDVEPPRFSSDSTGTTIATFRWVGPGWRTVGVAAGVGIMMALIGSFAPAFRVQGSHRVDAYVLEYVPGTNGAPDQLGVRAAVPGPGETVPPSVVQFYRDADPVGRPIDLTSTQTLPVTSDGTSHVYQARAPLTDGALALSNSVWAPSVFVAIDVLPWANVTVTSTTLQNFMPVTQATPLSLRLPEGRYALSLENNLHPSSTETITVTATGERVFRFRMPGFKPEGILQQLGIK